MAYDKKGAALRTVAVGAFIAALTISGAAQAVPVFDTFGDLPEFDAGSGIPNDAFAISRTTFDGNNITLGLSAARRFENPPLGNDGAGTFFANAGFNFGDPSDPSTPIGTRSPGATWNFNFFIGIEGGNATAGDFEIVLFYDFDPGVGNTGLGIINLSAVAPSLTEIEDSQNLSFGSLASNAFVPLLIPPNFQPFDPNVAGTYEFILSVSQVGVDSPLATVAIDVVVEAPEPGTLALFGVGLAGFGFMRRRRKSVS